MDAELLKEVLETLKWYSTETIGFCRKEGNGYVQISERAKRLLKKMDGIEGDLCGTGGVHKAAPDGGCDVNTP